MSPQERKLIFFAHIYFWSLLVVSTRVYAQCQSGQFQCPADLQANFPHPFADPNDCNFYHVCHSMEQQEIVSCGPDAHFNGESCVAGNCPTAIAGCGPLDSQEPANPNCVQGKFSCPSKDRRDPNDCRYYYECWPSGAYRKDCGAGKHYDGRKCVQGNCPSAIPNCGPLAQERTCETGYVKCGSNRGTWMKHDENDCRYYFTCKNGRQMTLEDCGEGYHYYTPGKCSEGPCSFALLGCDPQQPNPSQI